MQKPSVPKRWRDSLLTTSGLLLPLSSCIQDWQSPISFTSCKIHNCTQLHSLKTSHGLLKTDLTFFFLTAFFLDFLVNKKGGKNSQVILFMLSQHLEGSHQQNCPAVITILKTNKQKNLTIKGVPALKSLQSKNYRRNCRWM